VMYHVITSNLGHRLIEVPLRDDFSLDLDKFMDACERSTRILFLCSPNNPTGNQFPADQVRELAEKFEGLLIVDEAYVDYAAHSVVDLTEDHENVVVLRTFSKAFGLAGLRIGYAVTNQRIAAALKTIQLPYNVNVVSLELALRALTRIDEVRAAVDQIKVERDLLIGNVKGIPGLVPYPSDANFVFLMTPRPARQIRDALAEKGILVRCYDSSSLSNHMRVTVGTAQMNDRFVRALGEVMDA
jgi:histidinol-phosphate aminotransferase